MMMSTRPSAISFSSLRMVSIEVMRSLDSTMVRASGNSAGGFLLQALDAGADRDQRLLGLAMRTDMRARHREAAMMADQPLAKAMIDQPGIADGAGKAMPAGAAQRQRRIAAAVEEQQRLLAPLDRDLDLLGKPRRDEAAARAAASRRRSIASICGMCWPPNRDGSTMR